MANTAYSNVLIIEDEDTLRKIIVRNLTRRGIEVSEAATAEEAVRLVESVRPDLLLLDLNLPDRSGWDVLRDLRRRGIELPTVVISAVWANPSRLEEFRPLAYLPKPFPLEALLRLVVGPVPASGNFEALDVPPPAVSAERPRMEYGAQRG